LTDNTVLDLANTPTTRKTRKAAEQEEKEKEAVLF